MHLIPYAGYFLGPLVLAFWLGKRVLQARWAAFGFGLVFFFAAWICVMLFTQIPAAVFPALAAGTFLGSIMASIGAGFFEEAARWMAFRFLPVFGRDRRWQSGIMYAIGHSGMESIIVGGGIVLTYAVVTHAPQVLDAEMLKAAKESLQAGLGWDIYGAFERLLIGLLLHACFSLVVLLGVVRTRGVIVLLAMLWHFAHDMIAFNLHYLGDHWTLRFGFIVAILLVYGWALFRLVGAFPGEARNGAGKPVCSGKAIVDFPGRPANLPQSHLPMHSVDVIASLDRNRRPAHCHAPTKISPTCSCSGGGLFIVARVGIGGGAGHALLRPGRSG